MFQDKLKTEAIPERVFELCRIIDSLDKSGSNSDLTIDKVREIIEPQTSGSSTNYFPAIKKAAIELGLIEEEKNVIRFIGEKGSIKDIGNFRRYCNSVLFNDKYWNFYKLCKAFFRLNEMWIIADSITSDQSVYAMLDILPDFTYMEIKKTAILACRFWLSFLGFGYVQEGSKIFYLPNAYIALKDFIFMAELEKGKEYSISEFFALMPAGFSVLTDNDENSTNINMALSNALRQLHDSKEIELRRNQDSETVWYLFMNDGDEFNSQITHLTYKGVK